MGKALFATCILLLFLMLLNITYTISEEALTPMRHNVKDFVEQTENDETYRPTALRILTGQPISIKSAKYQVSLRLNSEEAIFFRKDFICSGSVISQRVVLTAAHCIYDNTLSPPKRRANSEFTILMGTNLLYTKSWSTLQFDAQEIVVHEQYNATSLANDIAMVLCDGYIPWNWSTVQAIPLNTQLVPDNTLCTVVGWPILRGKVGYELNVANVPIVEWRRCKITRSLSEGNLCAGSFVKQSEKACQNDSGGPLVCNGLLTGVVSSGVGCEMQLYPGIYANVSYYHDWIVRTNASFDYTVYNVKDSWTINQEIEIDTQ